MRFGQLDPLTTRPGTPRDGRGRRNNTPAIAVLDLRSELMFARADLLRFRYADDRASAALELVWIDTLLDEWLRRAAGGRQDLVENL